MYFLIIISLIIISIFLFHIYKQFNCLKIARNYQKNRDSKNAIKYYLKYININKDNSVLLDIANIYHYSNKNLFQAIQYYYLYLISVKKKNDILSKKNKLYASNKIKEILEYNISQSTDININKNYTNYTDSNFSLNDYLINNILDGFNKQNLFSNQMIQESNIIQELHNTNNNTNNQTNQEDEYIINNIDINVNNDIIDNTIYNFYIDDVPIHRPILNDNQNIHDTYVNNTIQNSINNIKTNQSISNKINLNIDEINNIIKDEINKQNFDNIKKNNILNVLESINSNSTKSYKNNMTLSELLILIFNRIYNEYNEDIQKTFLSNLIIELNDCIENNNIVCHTGIFNRIINSINLLDINVNIKTYDFLNEEIMNKCIAIRNTIDINIPNYEKELKNKIRLEMNKDYVDTNILTQSQLDDILNIWIEHI